MVSLNKELNKQQQIASVHYQCGSIVFWLNGALFLVFRAQDKTKNSDSHTDNHLRNLGNSDPNTVEPLWFAFDSHQKVVKVHDGMNPVVHSDKEQASRGLGDIRMPAIQQNRNVVIPMQENEGLFVNDNEKRIKKFTSS